MSINKAFDDLEEKEKFTPRHYLGVSQIGSENDRMLWFIFRWSMPIDIEPRVSRLLDLGNLLEDHLLIVLVILTQVMSGHIIEM